MKKNILCCLLFVGIIMGCKKTSDVEFKEGKQQKDVVQTQKYKAFPAYREEDLKNKEIVYYIEGQKLGVYDKNENTWKPIRDIENEFFYGFKEDWTYFTTGHSIENEFEVLKVKEGNISIIRREKNGECIFPLALDEGHYYFLEYADNNSAKNANRTIIEYHNGKFTEVLTTDKAICYGTIIEDVLYYSVYDTNRDSFDIYYVCLGKNDKKEQVYKTDISDGELFQYGKELLFIENGYICSKENGKMFEKKDYNAILDEEELLVQMYGNKEGDLQWEFIDMKNKKVLCTFKNIINYKVKNKILEIYGKDKVYKKRISN